VRPRATSQPGLNEDWFQPRSKRVSDLPPPPPRKAGAFAAVSLLLLAATLLGTLLLWRTGRLPQWAGTAPPMDEDRLERISITTLTGADIADTTRMTAPAALESTTAEVDDAPGPKTAGGPPALTSPETAASSDAVSVGPSGPVDATEGPKAGKDSNDTAQRAPATGTKAKSVSGTSNDSDAPAQPWPGTGPLPAPPTTAAAPTGTPAPSPADPVAEPEPTTPSAESSSPGTGPGF
jgi:hypothetical protein